LELALKLRPHEDISYLLAVICLQQSDVASAESHFRRALEANPKHLSSMVRLAMLKIADGDYPEAYRLLTEAMSFYPRYPDLQYGLGRVCLLMGKREEAYKQMTAALELNPEYAEVRREIALACDGADLAEAADHMRRSVEADPSDEQAVVNLGYLYHRQGEPDRAIEVLERATNQFPDSWRILKTLTILNLHRRSIPQAKLCFEMASRINPELQSIERSLRVVFNDESLLDDERLQLEEKFSSPESKGELYHHLGRLHLDFQKDRLASQYFRQSMEVGFDPVRNLMMLATYLGNSSDFVSAINLLDGIKAEGFAENVRRLMLGLFHANSGDHETSTRYYQQVMTDSPLFFHALGELAVCFRERGEYDDLLDDYLDYSRYNERNAPLTRRIALALANKGLLADARRHFDHATILDEDDGEAFHALGLLSLLRLDYVEAIRHFKTAAHRAPDSPLPQLALALTQLEVGDRFNGQLSLQRYIFVETADCWREMAEKLNLKLDRQET
jgi:tetratricopeptide (TPR) repeat protein